MKIKLEEFKAKLARPHNSIQTGPPSSAAPVGSGQSPSDLVVTGRRLVDSPATILSRPASKFSPSPMPEDLSTNLVRHRM